MTVTRETLLLLRPKWLAARRRGAVRGRPGRLLVVLLVGGVAWPLGYFVMVRLLTTLRAVEDVGLLLSARLLGLGLLLLFGILLVSNVIASLSSFYLSRDLPALRTAPVDWLSLYTARLVETAVSSSWMVLLILAPILAAYARVYEAGATFLAVVVLTLVPYLLIPAAIGSAITLLLVRISPARRSRDILAIGGLVLAALFVVVLRLLRPERLLNPDAFRNLADFLALLRAPTSPWMPPGWGAQALMDDLAAGFDPLPYALLWSTAAAAYVIGAALHGRLFPVCYTRAQEGRENRVRGGRGWTWLAWCLGPLGPRRTELILKDVKVFFRDATQWSQLIILGVLVAVYVYNMRVLPIGAGTGVGQFVIRLVVFLNLALTGFVLAAIAARFVFPMPSLEGRTLWLILSSPITPNELIGAKFRVGVAPLTLTALALTVGTGTILDVPPGMFVLGAVSIIGLGCTYTAQALAWGAAYPQFEAENAAQIPTSIGGMLFMLTALVTLGAVVAGQMWLLRAYLWSGVRYGPSRGPTPGEIAIASGFTLAVTAVATLVAFAAARRSWGAVGGIRN